jgi:hypothetical protein
VFGRGIELALRRDLDNAARAEMLRTTARSWAMNR